MLSHNQSFLHNKSWPVLGCAVLLALFLSLVLFEVMDIDGSSPVSNLAMSFEESLNTFEIQMQSGIENRILAGTDFLARELVGDVGLIWRHDALVQALYLRANPEIFARHYLQRKFLLALLPRSFPVLF